MKKTQIIKLVVAFIFISIFFTLPLTACNIPISPETGWNELQKAIGNSLTYDIYYYKITDFRDKKNIKNTKVNLHCDADSDGLIMDGDKYRNYALRIEEYSNSTMVDEIFCGVSKNKAGTSSKEVYINKDFSGGKLTSSKIKEMSIYDYLETDEYKPYALSTRLQELSELEFDDIDPNGEKYEFKQSGKVRILKFSLKDEYFEEYNKTHSTPSLFEGSYLEVELSYDRVAKIIVYDKVVLDNSLNITSYEEKYRFDLVYLGKNISIPNYDDSGMKYTWI